MDQFQKVLFDGFPQPLCFQGLNKSDGTKGSRQEERWGLDERFENHKYDAEFVNLEMFLAFEQADKDNDGFLSMEEYVKVFRLEVSRPAIYEKLHFNFFSEHGVNISKEEVALYFSSKVSFLKLRSSRAWA